jgi:hypothetical protein
MLLVIPVILIHKGSQDYFKSVIQQASTHNNDVIVLGDCDFKLGRFFNIREYYKMASEFESVYENFSTNGKESELICFSRWFILKDFMQRNNIPIALHLDTDVLLYANAEDEWKKFNQFDFTLSHRCCGSNSFFTLEGLSNLCNFMLGVYKNKTSYEYDKITSHYFIRQKHGLSGGVCDMTLIEFYSYQHCGKIGEMMHIIENSAYDHNINESDQYFRMSPKGIKDVRFDGNTPYCFSERLKKPVQFNTLHFQGGAKRFIPEYLK